tara:strand:+ start:147 stop:1127 length:981 start_codon:yes stop_codon:yes gene_type:complete
MYRYLIFFIFLLPPNLFSQCDNPIYQTITFIDETKVEAEYCGDINDRGERDGKGKLTYIDYVVLYEEGTWKNNVLNGNGKTVMRDGDVYEGNYELGKLVEGKYFRENENGSITYEGKFDGNYFNGKGKLINENKFQVSISEGIFFKDDLLNGTRIIKENLSGVQIKYKVEVGVETLVERNDVNIYKKDDIVGDAEFIKVPLIQRGSGNEGNLAYDVELEINGVKGEWLLDTGAMFFTIGKIMFDRLVKNGIKYTDLNKTEKFFGATGSQGSLEIIVIDELKIGDYIIKNVVAKVIESNSSLLGTDFLNKFSNVEWNMKKKELILYK